LSDGIDDALLNPQFPNHLSGLMNPTESRQHEAPPSPSRQSALLTLLADDDPAISDQIRNRLIAEGQGTVRWISDHRLHEDPSVRRRVREILDHFGSQEADQVLMNFLGTQGENLDLEEGVWLFTRTQFPEAPIEAYRAQLDDWAARLGDDMAEARTGAAMLERINRFLFVEMGFKGNQQQYYDPANSYLNLVMDRRIGIPISLCAVYLLICRRLKLPVAGIGMPGHFLCRYQTPREEHYIDAFHGGQLLSRIDCLRRLKQFAVDYEDTVLQPISARRILHRLISNLHLVYKERRERVVVARLERYLGLLTR
jgi:regulator of sirC expression with transglutaminase-like and TPR domain